MQEETIGYFSYDTDVRGCDRFRRVSSGGAATVAVPVAVPGTAAKCSSHRKDFVTSRFLSYYIELDYNARQFGRRKEMELKQDEEMSFEEIFKQNEKRIYFHMQRLGIQDLYREFYLEGLYAMWMAYKKYEPDKGPLSTFFNYNIRHRLIDMLRKKARDQYKDQMFINDEKLRVDHGNRSGLTGNPIVDSSGINVKDTKIWEEVKAALTENQWNWVYYHLILGMPYKEIAELKGVSTDAVKSWGREARRKLRTEPTLSVILELL